MNEESFLNSESFEFLQVNNDKDEVDRLLVAASDSYETRQPVSQDILSGSYFNVGGGDIFLLSIFYPTH